MMTAEKEKVTLYPKEGTLEDLLRTTKIPLWNLPKKHPSTKGGEHR